MPEEEKKEELFDPNFPSWHPRNYSRRAKPTTEPTAKATEEKGKSRKKTPPPA